MKICVRMLWIVGVTATLTLGGCGKEEAATTESGGAALTGSVAPAPEAPAAAVAAAPEAAVAAAPAAAGAGDRGKPGFGDKAAWEPRIAQGMDVLHAHSIQGFTGKTGSMPPKGGRLDFSDADVEAAVDYMVEAAR